MFKRSVKSTDSSLAQESEGLLNAEPLDNDEQAKIVENLRSKANSNEKVWRFCFGIALTLLSLMFLGFFIGGIFFPWNFNHELLLKSVAKIDYTFFYVYYSVISLNFGFGARILKFSIKKIQNWLKVAFGVLTILLTLICMAIFLHFSINEFTLIWIPLLPPCLYVFVMYIDSEIRGILHDVDNLENLKYEFKKV